MVVFNIYVLTCIYSMCTHVGTHYIHTHTSLHPCLSVKKEIYLPKKPLVFPDCTKSNGSIAQKSPKSGRNNPNLFLYCRPSRSRDDTLGLLHRARLEVAHSQLLGISIQALAYQKVTCSNCSSTAPNSAPLITENSTAHSLFPEDTSSAF